MEIKKEGAKSVLISDSKAKILGLVEGLKESAIKSSGANIVLNANLDGAFSVVNPGEYEAKDAWIMAMPSDVKEYERNDVFILNIEDVNVGLIGSTVKSLSNKQIEKVGLIDVLIVDLSGDDIKGIIDIIGEIEPQILIPLGETQEKIDQIVKDQGVKTIREESKLKVKSEEFDNEEYQMEIVKLS